MVLFCVVILIILIGSTSCEEEDTCHMRRRIHVIRIFFCVVTLNILIVFASSSSSSSSLSLSLSIYLSLSLFSLSLSLALALSLPRSRSLSLALPLTHVLNRKRFSPRLSPSLPIGLSTSQGLV
jgi:hypothetical protein